MNLQASQDTMGMSEACAVHVLRGKGKKKSFQHFKMQ